MANSWDLFFSYRRHDLDRARPLLIALAEAGIRVWRDETDIADEGSITSEIRGAIANCKALLAFYSRTYPLSNPCQQEITIAWLAAEQIGPTANERVWIVNPEDNFQHIPELLGDQLVPQITADALECAATAEKIKQRLKTLDTTLLGRGVRDMPSYHGMSPIQARRFAGRIKELWELHGKLTANRISIITGVYGQAAAQLRGLAGNGKSLLAREYSIRFGPAYPGGVFWLNAYGHDTTGAVNIEQREVLRQDQIREFAVRLDVPTEGVKPGEIEAQFWREMERRDKCCLWIVDDAPSGCSAGELQRAWNAQWTGASTLVTTRSKEYGELGSTLDLGVLSSSEALGLLCSYRKPTDRAEENAARKIGELLGYHPLAVAVAGGYLSQGLENFQSYAEALENPIEDAVEFGNVLEESLPTGHERSISATLLKSIRQLDAEGLDFLRIASVLAVAPFPVGLVAEIFELVGPVASGKQRTLKALAQTEALSLCERAGYEARTVHTLVSRTMRFQFPGEQRADELRRAAIVAVVRRLAAVRHIGEHSRIVLDIPHARHLVKSELQTREETKLALWIAYWDWERADYGSARKLQEEVLAASRRLLGDEHPDTLTARDNLARTILAQGDLAEARNLQEQVLAARRHLLGEEHPDTLTSMNNLATTQYEQGDLAGARNLQGQVLTATRRLLGKEHPDTLIAMSNLAAMLKAQGDLGGAREMQEQVLATRHRLLGREHPHTLSSMDNLALTMLAQGDFAGARKLQEQVLGARRLLLGHEHPRTLSALNNLAQTLKAQGDLAAGRKLEEEALAGRRHLLGEEHPATLTAMSNLAQTIKAQGDSAAARTLQEQVLAARYRLLSEEHPDTLTAMNNLAQTLYSQGDLAAARKLQEQVMAARALLMGKAHPDTLLAMNNLAETIHAQGDLPGARKLLQQAVADYPSVLGQEHPDTLRAMNNLAKTLYREGDLPGARQLLELATAGYRKVLGDEHPDTLRAMNNLARIKARQIARQERKSCDSDG